MSQAVWVPQRGDNGWAGARLRWAKRRVQHLLMGLWAVRPAIPRRDAVSYARAACAEADVMIAEARRVMRG